MRKIEQRMNAAIIGKIDWKQDNTEVIYYSGIDASDVYLHGNLIARVGSHSIELFDGGWQSNTTKSRLNAILQVQAVAQVLQVQQVLLVQVVHHKLAEQAVVLVQTVLQVQQV